MVVLMMTDLDTTITTKCIFPPTNVKSCKKWLRLMFLFSDFLAVKIKRLSSRGLKDPGWFTRFYQQQLLVERKKERYEYCQYISNDSQI